MPTAQQYGLCHCHFCGQLARVRRGSHDACCPECGAPVHTRKPDSVRRTWALLLSAYVLFIPANTYPIMVTYSAFGPQADTIMSGVIYLWNSGSQPIALVVFVASVFVPVFKLLSLTYLVISVQVQSQRWPNERLRIYRFLEFIGRWSMLDVFVVAMLVALIRIPSLAVVQAGPGIAAFGAVVVLTMFASAAFDPRLIWDSMEERHERA